MRTLSLIVRLFRGAAKIQRKRMTLTVTAIAWGTVATILLLSFGEGLKRQLTRGSAGMGSNIAVVWPGETAKAWQGMPPGRPIRPRPEDLRLLRERVDGLAGLVGEMRRWGISLAYGPKTVNARVTGVEPAYGELRNHIARPGGRFLNDTAETMRRRVIFLGDELARDVSREGRARRDLGARQRCPVSRPGRRVYAGKREIPWVLSGMGVAILSTPKGVMTGQRARQIGVGGEVLCRVW